MTLPKIIVPIVATSEEDAIKQAEFIRAKKPDIVELRLDHLWKGQMELLITEKPDRVQATIIITNITDICEAVYETLNPGRASGSTSASIDDADTIELLATFRTLEEGGECAIHPMDYIDLNNAMMEIGKAKYIDVELRTDEATIKDFVAHAHEMGCEVVVSHHDFEKTPSVQEMCDTLEIMQKLGADIAKIAVMPNNMMDVANLLSATAQMNLELEIPIITISMGKLGEVSRVYGGEFGSYATFATCGEASAPGQIDIENLKKCHF